MKGRERKWPRFPIKAKGIFPPLTAVFLIWVPALASWASPEEAPIWTFDFRDIFYDIAFLNHDRAVIVGARGRVLVTHPKYSNLWTPRDSGTGELLTCVSFVDDCRGWAAGHGGVILHTDDGGWTWRIQREPSSENQPLFDIQFPTPRVGYACGAYDTFLKTTDGGETWRNSTTGRDNIYNGLAFRDEATGYVVGEFGTVLRTRDGGSSWEQLEFNEFHGSLFGITLLPPETLLVYGVAGRVFRSEDGGRLWRDVSVHQDKSLFRGAAQGKVVVLVGASGTRLVSTDGGGSFHLRLDEEFTSYAGVGARPGGGFVCVGERGKIAGVDVPAE